MIAIEPELYDSIVKTLKINKEMIVFMKNKIKRDHMIKTEILGALGREEDNSVVRKLQHKTLELISSTDDIISTLECHRANLLDTLTNAEE